MTPSRSQDAPAFTGSNVGGLRRRHVGTGAGTGISGDVDSFGQRRNGSCEIRLRHLAHKRRFSSSVHLALKPHFAQHHLRVAREVFIDEYSPVRGLDGGKLPPCLGTRKHALTVFLQEDKCRS
jgi:hypothetical protein